MSEPNSTTQPTFNEGIQAITDAMHYASFVCVIGPHPDKPGVVDSRSMVMDGRVCLHVIATALRSYADRLDAQHAAGTCKE